MVAGSSGSLASWVTASFGAGGYLWGLVGRLGALITVDDVAETRKVSEQYNPRTAALGDSIHSSVPF